MSEVPFEERYPLHARLKMLATEARTIGEFLDFIEEQKWVLGMYLGESERLVSVRERKEEIIGLFLEIDPKELSKEKDKMYREIRADAATHDRQAKGDI